MKLYAKKLSLEATMLIYEILSSVFALLSPVFS